MFPRQQHEASGVGAAEGMRVKAGLAAVLLLISGTTATPSGGAPYYRKTANVLLFI